MIVILARAGQCLVLFRACLGPSSRPSRTAVVSFPFQWARRRLRVDRSSRAQTSQPERSCSSPAGTHPKSSRRRPHPERTAQATRPGQVKSDIQPAILSHQLPSTLQTPPGMLLSAYFPQAKPSISNPIFLASPIPTSTLSFQPPQKTQKPHHQSRKETVSSQPQARICSW